VEVLERHHPVPEKRYFADPVAKVMTGGDGGGLQKVAVKAAKNEVGARPPLDARIPINYL
jgi:hypothetical protein